MYFLFILLFYDMSITIKKKCADTTTARKWFYFHNASAQKYNMSNTHETFLY